MPTTLPSPQLIRQSADAGALVRQRRKAQQLRIDDAAALLGVSVDLLSRRRKRQGCGAAGQAADRA